MKLVGVSIKQGVAPIAAVLMALLIAVGCSPGGSGPGQADIEKLLKAQFTDTQYATRHYELSVESVQRSDSRIGEYGADGTSPNKQTTVFPCRVVWTRTTVYSSDNRVVKERFTGDYVFFLDEFGTWKSTTKNQTSEKI